MKNIYLSVENRLTQIDAIAEGCWVNMVNPTEAESAQVADELGLDIADLRAPLDIEERSRISEEAGYVLIIYDIPVTENADGKQSYETLPLGIILTPKAIVTTCLQNTPLQNDFVSGRVREFFTFKKSRFILQLLYNTAGTFLRYLRAIDTRSVQVEKQLHRSMRNNELLDMLGLEKSLVYFTTSLRSNLHVLQKLERTDAVKKYPDDEELLKDTIEENRQAMEMAEIYSNILSGTMDAFASVISNNQNIVMKFLALITIIMSIPTMIFSAYGMNVASNGMPWANSAWGFAIVIGLSAIISLIATIIFFAKKWF
jgi:magnesium transporter